jgi:hypothetical protein
MFLGGEEEGGQEHAQTFSDMFSRRVYQPLSSGQPNLHRLPPRVEDGGFDRRMQGGGKAPAVTEDTGALRQPGSDVDPKQCPCHVEFRPGIANQQRQKGKVNHATPRARHRRVSNVSHLGLQYPPSVGLNGPAAAPLRSAKVR